MTQTLAIEDALEERERDGTGRSWPVWLVALIMPTLALGLYGSSGRDDAYITYWVSDRLIHNGEIVNYNGERIEQSSSLLHTLLLALVGVVTRISVPDFGPWVAVVAGVLCVPAAYWLCRQLEPRGRWAAALLVATLPPLVYWSVGGLETTLAALLVLVACAATIRAVEGRLSWLVATVSLLGVVLVRPEMGLVFVIALLVAAGAIRLLGPAEADDGSKFDRLALARRALAMAGIVAAIGVVLAGLRQIWFGSPLPNPAMAKSTVDIGAGITYARETLTQSLVVVVLVAGVALAALLVRHLTAAWAIAGAVAAAGAGSVVLAGGDWMEAGRLLAPWLAVAMVLVGALLGRLDTRWMVVVTACLVAINVLGVVRYAANESTGTAAWSDVRWRGETDAIAAHLDRFGGNWWERRNSVHQRDMAFIDAADGVLARVARAVGDRPARYATQQAGMVAYYLQRSAREDGRAFEFIDQYGLTDDDWLDCRVDRDPGQLARVEISRLVAGDCGEPPDVISGLGPGDNPQLGNDYTVVYGQRGFLKSDSWPRGRVTGAGQWIAVRDDLLPLPELP